MNLTTKVAAGAGATALVGAGILWLLRSPSAPQSPPTAQPNPQPMPPPQQNPQPQARRIGTGWRVAGAMAFTGVTGYGIFRWYTGAHGLRAPKFLRNDEGLREIHQAGATVVPELIEQLHHVLDDEALKNQVVDLAPKTQIQTYDLSRRLWVETDSFDGDKDDLIEHVLRSVAPQTSWHVPRDELPADSARAKVWDGVAAIVDIMGASAEEEAREYEDRPAAGGES